MAVFVLKNPEVALNDTTDMFSAGCIKTLTINYEADSVETTAFTSSTGIHSKTYKAGFVGWTVDLDGLQDYDASKVDATLFDLIGSSSFTFRACVSSTGVSAAFPQFTGGVILTAYNPMTGGPGEAASFSISLQGSGLLLRNTASCSGY